MEHNQQTKYDRVEKSFTLHARKIQKYFAVRVPGNQAQDLTSDTFLVLLNNIDKVYPGDELPYLYKVASNLAKNYHKKNKKNSMTIQLLTDHPTVPAPNLDLYAAISKLPLIEQEILLLQVVDGLPTNTIAEVVDISPNSVRKKLSRTKKKLQEIYITD